MPIVLQSFPEALWNAVTLPAVLAYLYVLVGIGVYGGYDYWGFLLKAMYWLFFPFHAVVIFTLRLAVADYRWILVPTVFVLGLMFCGVVVNDGGNPLLAFILTLVASYFAMKPARFWTEKKGSLLWP